MRRSSRPDELKASVDNQGSLRSSYELDQPEVRAWSVQAFPYMIFYVTRPESIEVWRILHIKRDLPVWLQSPDAPR